MSEAPLAEAIGDVLVFRPASEHFKLDAAEAVSDLLDEPRFRNVRKVVVVLSRVRYIDSTGVSLLVRIGAERQLRLCELSARVRKVLGTLDLLNLFDVDPTEQDSLVALA